MAIADPSNVPALLSIEEVSETLRVSERKVRRIIDRRELRAFVSAGSSASTGIQSSPCSGGSLGDIGARQLDREGGCRPWKLPHGPRTRSLAAPDELNVNGLRTDDWICRDAFDQI